VINGGKY